MFLADIAKIRWAETRQYRKVLATDMGDYALGQVLTRLVPLVIFITWRETGHRFEAWL